MFVRRLQNCLHPSTRVDIRGYDHGINGGTLPDDVKEGCFAILAVNNKQPMRFVVKLSVLQNPAFLRLLQLAEEEYGFQHDGALTIPCQPDELKRILQDKIEARFPLTN